MLTYFCIEITRAQVKGVGYFGVVFCNPEWHGVTFSLVKFSGGFEVGKEKMEENLNFNVDSVLYSGDYFALIICLSPYLYNEGSNYMVP